MKYFPFISLLVLLSASCKIAEDNISGVYHPAGDSRTRLILKEDKTFELALLNPNSDLLLSSSGERMNYSTSGSWEYANNQLVLKTFVAEKQVISTGTGIDDSITRFTNISSFNFWNRYGDPVSIRYILLPPSKPRPHFGNSLYFFSQDLKKTDTLRFFFDGYPPVSYPGSIPASFGNNMHKVVLQEPVKVPSFPQLNLTVKKNKLIYEPSDLKFEKVR